jgi:hypothetical protein
MSEIGGRVKSGGNSLFLLVIREAGLRVPSEGYFNYLFLLKRLLGGNLLILLSSIFLGIFLATHYRK